MFLLSFSRWHFENLFVQVMSKRHRCVFATVGSEGSDSMAVGGDGRGAPLTSDKVGPRSQPLVCSVHMHRLVILPQQKSNKTVPLQCVYFRFHHAIMLPLKPLHTVAPYLIWQLTLVEILCSLRMVLERSLSKCWCLEADQSPLNSRFALHFIHGILSLASSLYQSGRLSCPRKLCSKHQ